MLYMGVPEKCGKQERITYGTHELTVALKFGDSARRYRWLDRY